MISVQLFGGLREAAAQLELIASVETNQNGLIIAFCFFFGLAVEPFKKRVAGALFAKGKLGFALGHPNQRDELDLVIFFKGALHELVFPIGPASNVKNAVRAFAAVDDERADVVGQS